ncbi:MAG: TonB-dependent receptor [Steroidobacteraceae bacterium]
MDRISTRSSYAIAMAVSASLYCCGALAQQAPTTTSSTQKSSDTDNGTLEEVTVTARYRSENLQQTPITITALTAADIQAQQLVNVNDLGSVVPNAYFRTPVSNYGPTETIGLRGITQVDFSYTFEPAVAVYVDDVYHATETGASMDLTDLERVEVLNGPQGTLFGKNALGGAIRLITVKPKGDDSGTFAVTYGQHHRVDLKGIGDFSLVPDKLFIRIIGSSSSEDGFGHYLDFACSMAAQGTPALSGSLPETISPTQGNGCALGGLGGFRHEGGKVELRYVASDDLEINLNANYTKQADEPYPQALLTMYQTTDLINSLYSNGLVFPKYGINYTGNPGFVSPSPYDNYATFGDVVTGQQNDPTAYLSEWAIPLTVDYRINDNLHAKLILAYETYQSNWSNDSDLTPFGLVQTTYLQEHGQKSAEFRLEGTSLANKLDWTTGLFFYDSHDLAYNTTNFDAFAFKSFIFPNGLLGNNVANDSYTDKNKSAFVHGEYKFTDQWSVSAGVRYTDENKANVFDHVNEYPADSIVVPNPKTLSSSRFDYSGSVNFQATNDILFYGSTATGFRSPGFNPRPFTVGQLQEVPGEHAIQYELGNKSDFLDHRLRANTAIFYIDYQAHLTPVNATQCDAPTDLNPATYQLAPGATCPVGTYYAGTGGQPWFLTVVEPASIRGIEEQLSATPLDGLRMDLNVGYNQFHSNASNPSAPGYVNPTVKLQPALNMSAGIQYDLKLGAAGTLAPRLDWTYQSYQTNGPIAAVQVHPYYIIPGYGLFNLRLNYTPTIGKWNIAAGVTNLFNKFYWQQLGANSIPPALAVSGRVGTPGLPREWTVTFTKNF